MPSSESIHCSSSPVPSVATTSACVSPRVNSAEPWVRGITCTWQSMGRTVFKVAPVDTLACLQDARADDVLLDLLERIGELDLVGRGRILRQKFGNGLRLRFADFRVALLLARDLEGLLEVALYELLDLGLVFVFRVRQNPRALSPPVRRGR